MHQFLKFIFRIKLYMFRTVPPSIIRSFSLYTQQWYICHTGLLPACDQQDHGRIRTDVLILRKCLFVVGGGGWKTDFFNIFHRKTRDGRLYLPKKNQIIRFRIHTALFSGYVIPAATYMISVLFWHITTSWQNPEIKHDTPLHGGCYASHPHIRKTSNQGSQTRELAFLPLGLEAPGRRPPPAATSRHKPPT